MRKFFASAARPVVIVSGLPRSGTSMMMKMLECGGLPVLVDDSRRADRDNPNGYYEDERIKQLRKDSSWLKEAEGKAIKVISYLLSDLPPERKYKILFMKREIPEILLSQRLMLERRGENPGETNDQEMTRVFQRHLRSISLWLEERKNMEVLEVDYNQTVQRPLEGARAVNRFLASSLNVGRMAEAVDAALHRQRI